MNVGDDRIREADTRHALQLVVEVPPVEKEDGAVEEVGETSQQKVPEDLKKH